MRSITLCCLLLALSLPAISARSQLAPWWIPEEGCVFVWSGPKYTWAGAPLNLVEATEYNWPDDGLMEVRYYTIGDDDDLYLYRRYWGYSLEETNYFYNPPLKELDYPLVAGKTWVSHSHITNDSGLIPRDLILTMTVIGPQVVYTVIGWLEVMEVVRVQETVGVGSTTTTLYLHEQYGNVNGLHGVQDCDLVASEQVSWGSVKSLFR
ncbi:MAG: hypothetical protein RBT60_15155 [Candidatus Krumholzibacteria bacterium]|jgi:hypothetical protein|nr:hypothetical protein [Candidatus Krumholzibacteria bacterium]